MAMLKFCKVWASIEKIHKSIISEFSVSVICVMEAKINYMDVAVVEDANKVQILSSK